MVHVWTLEYEGQPENRKVPPLPLLIKKKKKKPGDWQKGRGSVISSFVDAFMLFTNSSEDKNMTR